MAVSRADRRRDRQHRFVAVFGEEAAERALDLMEIVELAWNDCYREVTPPDGVVEDMLVVSGGTVEGLIESARLGITDWLDLRLAADARR